MKQVWQKVRVGMVYRLLWMSIEEKEKLSLLIRGCSNSCKVYR